MKILIAVVTCHERVYKQFASTHHEFRHHEHHDGSNDEQVKAIRDTWMKDVSSTAVVDVRLFYGTPHDREPLPDEVFLNVADDYEHLPHKVKGVCQYALDNNYDFVFKTDSDTYLWLHRLVDQLKNNKPFDYAGYTFLNKGCSGCGYWLSRRAFSIVAAQSNPDKQWAEDKMVFETLRDAGIHPHRLSGIEVSPYPQYWFDPDKVTPNLVCAHAFQPAAMRELYARERR